MNVDYSDIFVGILLVGFFFGGFYAIVTYLDDDQTGYNVGVDQSFKQEFDFTQNVSVKLDEVRGDIKNLSVDKTAFLALVPDALSLIKNLVTLPFDIVTTLVEKSAQYLGLPEWVSDFLDVAMLVVIIFTFIALILRYRS